MKKVLVYFTNFTSALGGGEYTPLSFIAELQKRNCEVTLALNWRSDVPLAASTLGIDIDFSRLNVVYVKPSWRWRQKFDAFLPVFRTRRLKKLARNADVCISTANMFDFGKPAHHFIYLLRHFGDNAFNAYLLGEAPPTGAVRKLRTFLVDRLMRPLLGVPSARQMLADRRQIIYPTSNYVERVMRDFYGPFTGKVFYPPTLWEPTAPAEARNPLKIVVLGQLFPEKKPLNIVSIVRMARGLTGLDLQLALAGPLTPSPYLDKLQAAAAANPWLSLPGPQYGADKEKFLLSGTYAIHAERDEAFGISVTEYLKAGLIPIVPDDGGAAEVVAEPRLGYRTETAAAKILTRLLTDAAFRTEMAHRCADRAENFSKAAYLERQKHLLDAILATDGSLDQ